VAIEALVPEALVVVKVPDAVLVPEWEPEIVQAVVKVQEETPAAAEEIHRRVLMH
jgi:hypothetical protein